MSEYAGDGNRYFLPDWKLADFDVRWRCDQDCRQGGCPRHVARFRYQSTSSMFSVTWDTTHPEETMYFDASQMWMLARWLEYMEKAEDVWDGTLVTDKDVSAHEGRGT